MNPLNAVLKNVPHARRVVPRVPTGLGLSNGVAMSYRTAVRLCRAPVGHRARKGPIIATSNLRTWQHRQGYTTDTTKDATTQEFIQKTVKENDVVIFMKGTIASPMCGFSRAVCEILHYNGVVKMASVNVLEDNDIRQGIKDFTTWPTIPQVFLKGEFVGGYDILLDMHKSGELKETLEKHGLIPVEVKKDE